RVCANALPPRRRLVALVRGLDGRDRGVSRALARQSLHPPALGVRRAASARAGGLVRPGAGMAGHRLCRPAEPFGGLMTDILRQSSLPDPFRAAPSAGWKVVDASTLTEDRDIAADVALIGTVAGGGTAAGLLSATGAAVGGVDM